MITSIEIVVNLNLKKKLAKVQKTIVMMVTALGEIFSVGYRSVVPQNEMTQVFTILYIFRTASPFSRVQINLKIYVN